MTGDMSLTMSLWQQAVDLRARLDHAEALNDNFLFEAESQQPTGCDGIC